MYLTFNIYMFKYLMISDLVNGHFGFITDGHTE